MISFLCFIEVATRKLLQTWTFKKEGFYFLSQPQEQLFPSLDRTRRRFLLASVFFFSKETKQSDRNKVKVEMKIKCSPAVPITNTAAYGCRGILLEPDRGTNRNKLGNIRLSQLSRAQKANRKRDTNGKNLKFSHFKCPVCY